MTIQLDNPVGRPLGPGYMVGVVGMSGPTPLDDFVVVSVIAPISETWRPVILYGTYPTFGATSALVVLGFSHVGNYNFAYSDYMSPGAPIEIHISQRHADWSIVEEHAPYTGFWWEGFAQQYQLLAKIASESSGGVDILQRILDSVRKVFGS